MRKFTSFHGSGGPTRYNHVYDYHFRVTIPKMSRWVTLQGSLRANRELSDAEIKQALTTDVVKKLKQQNIEVDASDLRVEAFSYTKLP